MADSKLHENVRNQAQDTAKTEEKAGKYKPLVVFDTAAGVSGPRWLSESGAAEDSGSASGIS